jgi:hypothetical protein
LVTQPQSNKPPKLTEEEEMQYQPPISEGGGNIGGRPKLGNSGGLMKSVLISLIISIVVVFGVYLMGYFVTKADFTKNLGSVATDIGKITTTSQKTLDTFQTTITDLVDSKLATALKGVPTSAALTAATDTANKAKTTADGLQQTLTQTQNTATSAQQTATKAQTDVATMKTDVEALKNGSNKDTQLSQDIDSLKTRIGVLETKVTTLSNPTNTPTPTPTTSTNTTPPLTVLSSVKVISGGSKITAVIIPNDYISTTAMTLSPITLLSKSTSGMFNIKITNTDNETKISGIQLAVGLGIFDTTTSNPVSYALPTTIIPSLSSNGDMSVIWVQQNTGVNYIVGFLNQASTGQFSIGNLELEPLQSKTLQQTFTLSVK